MQVDTQMESLTQSSISSREPAGAMGWNSQRKRGRLSALFLHTRPRVCPFLPRCRHLSDGGVSLAASLWEVRQALRKQTGAGQRLRKWDQVVLCSTLCVLFRSQDGAGGAEVKEVGECFHSLCRFLAPSFERWRQEGMKLKAIPSYPGS